jgi:hypothetical protein
LEHTIDKVSEHDKELIRGELVFVAEYLRARYDMKPGEAHRVISEMLTVSV